MMNHVIEFFACLSVAVLIMSFLEHQIHRTLMHRKTFLCRLIPALKKTFEHHAHIHHGQYYKTFADEPVAPGEDRGIRLSLKEGVIEALPVSALLAVVSMEAAIMFELVVCFHHTVWNQTHLEMHKPQGRFFSNWPAFRFMVRHHYLHHRYPDKNFNVVFPIFDYVLGTNIHASKSDWKDMHDLGLIDANEFRAHA
jgi:hypothetical protein